MNATPIMLPLGPLLLIIGIIVYIIFCINLFRTNPKIATLLILVPIVFVLFLFSTLIYLDRNHKTSYNTYSRVNETAISNQNFNNSSPIWSEGIESEFKADVYPSKTAAVRSIALRLNEEAQKLSVDLEQLDLIDIYPMAIDSEFAEILQDAILKRYPDKQCNIHTQMPPETRPNSKKLLISLNPITYQNGVIVAKIIYTNKDTNIGTYYVDKPWVENFSELMNRKPYRNYLIAKSTESSLSAEEANRQAMEKAWEKLSLFGSISPEKIKLNSKDALLQDMIVDKFIQSFDGSVGKIWREALLLDCSHDKLSRLAANINGISQVQQKRWLNTIFSIIGLFVLIVIAYAFLNAATKGYYSLTLKIAGVILAAIILFIILTIT